MSGSSDGERAVVRRCLARGLAVVGLLLAASLAAHDGDDPSPSLRDGAWLVWPQGWNLFSGGEYTPELAAYQPTPAGWADALSTPQLRGGGLLGFGRGQRNQVREVEYLASAIPPGAWHACGRPSLAECPDALAGRAVIVVDSAALPSLCGTVALTSETLREPGSEGADSWRIDRVALIQVRCG